MTDLPATPIERKNPAAPKRKLITRRRFFKFLAGSAAIGAGTLVYGNQFAPYHLTIENVSVPISNLPFRWRNQKLIHLSDLHCGPRVDPAHIIRAFEMSAAQAPLAVVITGDLVENTSDYLPQILPAIRSLTNKIPVIATLGNHDYSGEPRLAEKVVAAFRSAGVTMLRNQSYKIFGIDDDLTFVGLGDFWNGPFDPAAAFADVAPGSAAIALSHNPDSYESIAPFPWDLMLSGHTHGGQVRLPLIGALRVPVRHKERDMGLFHLDRNNPRRALYVTRGVGHLAKIRLFCPPEITCITLTDC